MKKIHGIIIATALLLSAGCNSDDGIQNGTNPTSGRIAAPRLSPEEVSASEATADFQFNFFRQICENAGPDENIVVSPVAARSLLSMLAATADSDTRGKITRMLGCDDITSLNSLSQKLAADLRNIDQAATTVEHARSIWYNSTCAIDESLLQLANDTYLTAVYPRNFMEQTALIEDINRWSAGNTGNSLSPYLTSVSGADAMFCSAMHFKGEWKYPFNKTKSTTGEFHGSKGETFVNIMHQSFTGWQLAHTPGYSAAVIPVGNTDENGGYNVVFICPKGEMSLKGILRSLNPDKLQRKESIRLSVKVPRFHVTSLDYNLNDVLTAMGMPENNALKLFHDSFNGLYDFSQSCSFSATENTYLITQYTSSSHGTGMNDSEPRAFLELDKPFLFLVTETATKSIVLAGRIMNI